MGVECLNLDIIDEVWMVPCGIRKDKVTTIDPMVRMEMLQILRDEYLENNIQLEDLIKIDPIEIDNHFSIPTYDLLEIYHQKYPDIKFYFIMGSDLLDGLIYWDE